MKRISLFLFLMFFWASAQQKDHTLYQGQVFNLQKEPLTFVKILVFDASNKPIKQVVTNEKGAFSFQAKDASFLEISHMEYEKQKIPIKQSVIYAIFLAPLANTLDEITIKKSAPLYKATPNGFLVDVGRTMLKNTGKNATQLISELPFVYQNNEKLEVIGAGAPEFYVDGRLLQDLSEMEKIQASDIDKIEVMTLSGAQHDASKGAVIKIKLKNKSLGTSLYVLSNYGLGKVFSDRQTIDFNYQGTSFRGFVSVDRSVSRYKPKTIGFQRYLYQNTMYAYDISMQDNEKRKAYNYTLGAVWNPFKNSALGVRYVFKPFKQDLEMSVRGTPISNQEEKPVFIVSSQDKKIENHYLNAYYDGDLAKNLHLNVNFDMARSKSRSHQKVSQKELQNESGSYFSYRGNHRLYGAKTTVSYLSKIGLFDGGFQYNNTWSDQNANNNDMFIEASSKNIDENSRGAFLSYKTKWKNLGLMLGYRYQWAKWILSDKTSKAVHKYDRGFLNVGFSYALKKFNLQFGYEQKIKYPSYVFLAQEVTYYSPYAFLSGNSELLPELSDKVSFMFSRSGFQFFTQYTSVKNQVVIEGAPYQDKKSIRYRPVNVPGFKNWVAGLTFTKTFAFWQPSTSVILNKQWLSFKGTRYNNPMVIFKMNNTFSLPYRYTLSLNAALETKGDFLAAQISPNYKMDITLNKKLAKNWEITLAFNDFLNTHHTKMLMESPSTFLRLDKKYNTQKFSWGIKYRFSSFSKEKAYKGDLKNEEVQRLSDGKIM